MAEKQKTLIRKWTLLEEQIVNLLAWRDYFNQSSEWEEQILRTARRAADLTPFPHEKACGLSSCVLFGVKYPR